MLSNLPNSIEIKMTYYFYSYTLSG